MNLHFTYQLVKLVYVVSSPCFISILKIYSAYYESFSQIPDQLTTCLTLRTLMSTTLDILYNQFLKIKYAFNFGT